MIHEKKEMTYQEAYGIVQDYNEGKNVPYNKYSEAMDILWM